MTATEFRSSPYSAEWNKFLQTQAGKEFLGVLHGLRPGYESSPHEVVFIENRGAIRGYELCVLNAVALASPPKIITQPEANYGVPDKVETKKE